MTIDDDSLCVQTNIFYDYQYIILPVAADCQGHGRWNIIFK